MNLPWPSTPKHTALLAAMLLTAAAHGQTARPDAPSWTQRWSKTELALAAADATVRTLDITSTHALLASPCKCFQEDDPLSPGTRSVLPLAAFQYGMSALAVRGGHELRRRGHPRLGLLMVAADVVSESLAVAHNLRQHEAAKATGLTPGTARVRLSH